MPRTKEKSKGAKLPPNYPGHERAWHLLYLGRLIDNEAPNFLRKAMGWSYHAPNAGHDAIQLALGCSFRAKHDHLFPYYRDLTTALAAGLTAREIILNGLSRAEDVASGGRHMSNHFAKPEINVVSSNEAHQYLPEGISDEEATVLHMSGSIFFGRPPL